MTTSVTTRARGRLGGRHSTAGQ